MMIDRRTFLLSLGAAMVTARAWARDAGAFDRRFRFTAIEGGELAMADYAGKAVLLVNTASRCGFTPQYAALQDTWERYRARGLVVLGVPSNDFGGQEPLDEAGIKQFCDVQFGIDFPMTAKQRVAGPEAHPLYRWIAESLGARGRPTWNFHKFLIDPQGQLVGAWPARIAPGEPAVSAAIEQALPRQAPEIEPSHLGGLYLEKGDLPKAEERLHALDRACFFGCEEYRELQAAIEAYRAAHSS